MTLVSALRCARNLWATIEMPARWQRLRREVLRDLPALLQCAVLMLFFLKTALSLSFSPLCFAIVVIVSAYCAFNPVRHEQIDVPNNQMTALLQRTANLADMTVDRTYFNQDLLRQSENEDRLETVNRNVRAFMAANIPAPNLGQNGQNLGRNWSDLEREARVQAEANLQLLTAAETDGIRDPNPAHRMGILMPHPALIEPVAVDATGLYYRRRYPLLEPVNVVVDSEHTLVRIINIIRREEDECSLEQLRMKCQAAYVTASPDNLDSYIVLAIYVLCMCGYPCYHFQLRGLSPDCGTGRLSLATVLRSLLPIWLLGILAGLVLYSVTGSASILATSVLDCLLPFRHANAAPSPPSGPTPLISRMLAALKEAYLSAYARLATWISICYANCQESLRRWPASSNHSHASTYRLMRSDHGLVPVVDTPPARLSSWSETAGKRALEAWHDAVSFAARLSSSENFTENIRKHVSSVAAAITSRQWWDRTYDASKRWCTETLASSNTSALISSLKRYADSPLVTNTSTRLITAASKAASAMKSFAQSSGLSSVTSYATTQASQGMSKLRFLTIKMLSRSLELLNSTDPGCQESSGPHSATE